MINEDEAPHLHVLNEAVLRAAFQNKRPVFTQTGHFNCGDNLGQILEAFKTKYTATLVEICLNDPLSSDTLIDDAYLAFSHGSLKVSRHYDSVEVIIYCDSLLVTREILTLFASNSYPLPEYIREIPAGEVYVVGKNQWGKTSLINVGNTFNPLVRENYSQAVLKQYDFVTSQLKSREPVGRISIFQGPPGTGKTYLVRGLVSEIGSNQVILLTGEQVAHLMDEDMITTLIEMQDPHNPFVFVIEDADECLSPRKAGNMNSISQLLNFSDGIIGSLLDVRVICTTNTKIKEFDEAIVRPGRLCSLVNVGKLSATEAAACYKRIGGTGEWLGEDMTLGEVYKIYNDERLGL